MLRAWRRIFERLELKSEERADAAEIAALRAAVAPNTPVVGLGLSARAANALERENVLTADDLIALPPLAINTMRGVGVETRRELVELQQELRERLGVAATRPRKEAEGVPAELERLDTLVAHLLPRRASRNATEVDAVARLLGLEEMRSDGPWPSQTEVAAELNVSRGRVGQLTTKARDRWRKLPGVTRLGDEIIEHLDALGGVAAVGELERAVAGDRGADDRAASISLARAAVRAATEVELAHEGPRLAQRRLAGGRVLLSSAGETLGERQRALDYAVRLGDLADELASTRAVTSSLEALAQLGRIARPAAIPALTQDRLVQLAAGASSIAAASPRLEIYPRGLPPERALTLGRGALLGAEQLSPPDVIRRIAARFPQPQRLPERRALDRLLRDCGVNLEWDDAIGAYVVPRPIGATGLTSHESSLTRLGTAVATPRHRPPADPDVVEAREFEARLRSAQRDGGMLVLMAYAANLTAASQELTRLDVTSIDLDALLIRQLHATAEDFEVRWDLVLRSDSADRSSEDWINLNRLVQQVIPSVEEEIAKRGGTVLLKNLGLLARYGQLGLLERLRKRVMDTQAPLKACWVLVPSDDQTELPQVDGEPVPVLTPNESLRVSHAWLRNVHRAAPREQVA
jgi:hypothetical protein